MKIWVFGMMALILMLMMVLALIPTPSQKEMVTSVDLDGTTFYVPNENALEYFANKTMVYLVTYFAIIPLAVVCLIMTVIYFVKNIRLRKNVRSVQPKHKRRKRY